jgi:hypothetical protein
VRRYYYAGGRRVELEADDDLVAVDRTLATAAGVDIDDQAAAGAGRPSGEVVLARRSSFDEKRLASLRGAGALQPVFRRDRAVVVALPEVRVEFDDPEQRRAVKDALSRSPHGVVIAEDTTDRLVLHISSGSGDEALAVANYLYERAHPAAASVRFVQFVPRPGPGAGRSPSHS